MTNSNTFPIYRMAAQASVNDSASQAADGLFWQAIQKFGQRTLSGALTLALTVVTVISLVKHFA